MAARTSIKVLIDGKILTLAGYEDEEYLHRVADYLNRKILSLSEVPGYRRMGSDLKGTMLALNLADDFFKAKDRADALEESMEAREKDAYEIKQDLISAQLELDNLRNENLQLQKELALYQKDSDNKKNGYRGR